MQAETSWREGNWAGLLDAGQMLLERFPSLAFGYRVYAAALVANKRLDEAEQVARKALRRFPRSPDGHNALVQVLLEKGELRSAISHLRKVMRYGRSQIYSSLELCRALKALGQFDEADVVMQRAVEEIPNEVRFLREHALLAEERADWHLAIQRWVRAVAAIPGNPELRVRASKAMRQAGCFADAAKFIEEAIFIFPRDSDVQAEQQKIASELAAAQEDG